MKGKPRQRRPQGQKPPRPKRPGRLIIDDRRIFVVRPSKIKHRGKRYYAQLALTQIFQNGIPQHVVNYSALTRKVNDVLRRSLDCSYAHEDVDTMTVRRAVADLRAANR
jgi:hypothetical protein